MIFLSSQMIIRVTEAAERRRIE